MTPSAASLNFVSDNIIAISLHYYKASIKFLTFPVMNKRRTKNSTIPYTTRLQILQVVLVVIYLSLNRSSDFFFIVVHCWHQHFYIRPFFKKKRNIISRIPWATIDRWHKSINKLFIPSLNLTSN